MEDNRDVTAQELSEWLGVSDRVVRELAQRNIIPQSKRNRYPLKASVTAYCNQKREVAAGRAPSGDSDLDLVAERARLAKEQADGQEIKNALARSEVVPAADVEKVWGQLIDRFRVRLLAVAPRVAPRVAPLIKPSHTVAEIEALIADAINEALAELSRTEVDSEDEEPGSSTAP